MLYIDHVSKTLYAAGDPAAGRRSQRVVAGVASLGRDVQHILHTVAGWCGVPMEVLARRHTGSSHRTSQPAQHRDRSLQITAGGDRWS